MGTTARRLGSAFLTLTVLGACLAPALAAEPSVLVVRNESGVDVERVTLTERRARADRASRLGSIAPVPDGVAQSVERGATAPRLPRKVVVRWVDASGREFARDVDLKPILKGATGHPGEALVFRIVPGNDLVVEIGEVVETSR